MNERLRPSFICSYATTTEEREFEASAAARKEERRRHEEKMKKAAITEAVKGASSQVGNAPYL